MVRGLGIGAPGRRVFLLGMTMALLLGLVLPGLAAAQGEGKRIMLYTGTTGFRHTDGINGGVPTLTSKLQALGYTVDREDCVDNGGATAVATNCDHADKNPRIFTDANLARYDAVVFLNMSWSWAGGNKPGPLLDDAQKAAIIKYTQNGGGIAAIHNATDAAAGRSAWDWWDGGPNSMVGSTMPGHSANNIVATVQTADKNHLSTKDLPDTWTLSDEHYNFLRNVRGTHHVLATFDERTYNPGPNAKGQDHPITWCKLYDGRGINDGTSTPKDYTDGRTWVTGMGHNGARYTENGGDGPMVKMMLGGIRWVAGEGKKTDCSGTVWSSFRRTVLVANANQPIGIDIAKDGKVYWTEMGLIGNANSSWNSEGSIVMHDQKGAPGNKTTVVTIPTRADHGNSEDGVMGFTLQPGFDLADPNKRHVFAYYSPRPQVGDNWPMSNADARIAVGYNVVSRWTLTADGKSVEPNSERIILRVPKAKIGGNPAGFPGGPTDGGPGHVGGAGLDFDSEGNLYLGVGDDVSPNAPGHDRYIPMDYRASERWDARKTSANTGDLRGKVLRIKPSLADIPSSASPGVDSTYSIPAGNLFPVGTEKTRPEIYAMGFRQPFTLHTDAKNPGLIGVGEFCHDNNTDRAQRAPAGVCEWNLVGKAQNAGWPFCVGDNSPANTAWRWKYTGTAAAPSTGVPTGEQYDCSKEQIPSDINWAPEGETAAPPTFPGLDMIPKPEPATIWKKYPTVGNQGMQRVADFGDLQAGGMQPLAGPIFRYNSATASSGGFPAYYDGSWFINNRGSTDGFWKEVKLRSDNNQMLRVNDWLPYNHAGNAANQLNGFVIGTQFGDDGALYMARYPVGCCRTGTSANSQVQIVKISFEVYDETTAPEVTATLDPATPGAGRTYTGPVTVNFSATDPANPDPSQPHAGMDYIEYRQVLNGVAGQWVRTSAGNLQASLTAAGTFTEQGSYTIEYRAADKGGNMGAAKSVSFWINTPVTAEGTVKAAVPASLGLSIGEIRFDPFAPGVTATYQGRGTATVTSSWPATRLAVHDASATNTGRLVNGTSVIGRNMQVADWFGNYQDVSNATNARVVALWSAPLASAAVPLNFRQSVLNTDALSAGEYTKTLTFTLSSPTP
ncbi:ThuA domain-containing protein [Solirubrobacter sp. CPCC 204708]|uniref:ThuA domain-containing protein n=1 Tax=Solirubrobacter deserti TaxID=2282478 RepID=A0ABT4RJF7_9ACTN|nr:ThuA domain-containing protein [Solirubrobacter deserti]MBE2317684.1 ThuA domain-containing protein [Solirubrobacter deserti]MDA0138635.1 ThuA domain-containing protein [Solirubrobacter deserti]